MYILNRRYKAALYFSLVCLFLMPRGNWFIPTFFPGLDWQIVFRLEHIDYICVFIMLTMFIRALFPGIIHKLAGYAYYSICILFVLMIVIFPSGLSTRYIMIFNLISLAYAVYFLIRLALTFREKKLRSVLAFLGVFVFYLAVFYDILASSSALPFIHIRGLDVMTPTAMLFFVFCYTMVIALDYAQKDSLLDIARQRTDEFSQKYETLRQANMDMDIPKAISDFGLSGRETDIVYLLLDGKTRMDIADILGISTGTVSKTCSRIYKKADCKSLAELMKLLGLSGNLHYNSGQDDRPIE